MESSKSPLMLLLIALLTALFGSTLAQEDEYCLDTTNCCENRADQTVLGDSTNCTMFYICSESTPLYFACDPDKDGPYFDTKLGKCTLEVTGCDEVRRWPDESSPSTDYTYVYETTTLSSNGNCTENGAYFVPYPGDCSKYMICSDGILLPDVKTCPPGTLFDSDLQECNLASIVECKPTCPSTATISLPHERNCSLYWFCSLGKPTLRSCPRGLFFDPKLGACNIETAVFCPNLCPSQGTISLPNSESCRKYWLCVSGDATLKECPANLLFDPNIGQCNLASAVYCETLITTDHWYPSTTVSPTPTPWYDTD